MARIRRADLLWAIVTVALATIFGSFLLWRRARVLRILHNSKVCPDLPLLHHNFDSDAASAFSLALDAESFECGIPGRSRVSYPLLTPRQTLYKLRSLGFPSPHLPQVLGFDTSSRPPSFSERQSQPSSPQQLHHLGERWLREHPAHISAMRSRDLTQAYVDKHQFMSYLLAFQPDADGDRCSELQLHLSYLKVFFGDRIGKDVEIVVAEMARTDQPFPRGLMLNAAFLLSRSKATFVQLADVDMFWERNVGMEFSPIPVFRGAWESLSNYKDPDPEFIGAFLQLPTEAFVDVNGFSNGYWGWGREFDDLYMRLDNRLKKQQEQQQQKKRDKKEDSPQQEQEQQPIFLRVPEIPQYRLFHIPAAEDPFVEEALMMANDKFLNRVGLEEADKDGLSNIRFWVDHSQKSKSFAMYTINWDMSPSEMRQERISAILRKEKKNQEEEEEE